MPSEIAFRAENIASGARGDIRSHLTSRRRRWDSPKKLPHMSGAFPPVLALSLNATRRIGESTRSALSPNPTPCSVPTSTSDALSDYENSLLSIETDERVCSHTGMTEPSKALNSISRKTTSSAQTTKLEEAITRLNKVLRDRKKEVDSLALENAQLREQVESLQQRCIVGEHQLQIMGRDMEVARRAAEQVQRQHKDMLSLLQQIYGAIQRMNSGKPSAESAIRGSSEDREPSSPPHQERRRDLREKARRMLRDIEDFVQTKAKIV